MDSSVYCLSELRAPWGFRVEGRHVAKFHLVLDGHCWLHIDDTDPIELWARATWSSSRAARGTR